MAALSGTIVFSTIGRPFYGFDIFSVAIPPHLPTLHSPTFSELRLTDGLSVNFNGHYVDDDGTLAFVSERSGAAVCYTTLPGRSHHPHPLPSIPASFFHDRPTVKNGRLYLVSNHEPCQPMPSCWTAVYSAALDGGGEFRRLTPYGTADFSPAVSGSGELVAVASYGSQPWDTNDYFDHKTDIVVFSASHPSRRKLVCNLGGWPTWLGDATIFFHRKSADGWWSVYRLHLPTDHDALFAADAAPIEPVRITPPGVHAFTPAVALNGQQIAVATRRSGSEFRHIEVFDMETESFHRVTELLNPCINHYNPFFSPDSRALGYHRFRGGDGPGELRVPHLEEVKSPVEGVRLMRLNGDCGSFSPDGKLVAFNPDFDTGFDRSCGVRVARSDGSKCWTVMKNRIAFSTAWSPTEGGVIYTSAGMIFESIRSSVQIARIEFDPAGLTGDAEKVTSQVKFLTKAESGNNAFPSVSPDGKQVVFRSGRSGHKNLYIVDAVEGEWKEGGIRRLTEGPWIDTMPSWSPDGKLIAFSSNRHNPKDVESFSLYLVHPDGTGLRRVTVAGAVHEGDRERNNHVVFSGDMEWLVFAGNMGGVSAESISMGHQFQPFGDIFACRLDGSGLQRLTWTAYENGTPAWHGGGEAELGRVKKTPAPDADKLEGQFEEVKWLAPPVDVPVPAS